MESISHRIANDLKKNYQLYLLILPALAVVIIFHYVPMYGIQLAFKDYRGVLGITGSHWVGFKHFIKLFSSYNFNIILMNTLSISFYSIVFAFPPPILFALLLNELRSEKFKKVVQTVTYIPHFISTTILVAMLFAMFNQSTGIVNIGLNNLFGVQPIPFMQWDRWFRFIFVFSGIWQVAGFGAILYIAVLSTVDPSLHEAAIIDGANRLQRVWYINVPCLIPTIVILLILRTGSIISVGFEKVFLMQNTLNLHVSEVLSTYVYKLGLIDTRYDFSTAVGLFTSLVNCMMLLLVNMISRALGENSLW
ncbi:MAG: ABC transporter permease subunit [Clostridia bacterium]